MQASLSFRAMRDDFEPTSELFRVMPPRRRKPSELGDLGEALGAAKGSRSEFRQALDAARGTGPETIEDSPERGPAVTSPLGKLAARQRRRIARLRRALSRVDVWILIATLAGVVIAIAGVVIAYLTLMKSP